MAIVKGKGQAAAKLERVMDFALVSNRKLHRLNDDFGVGSPGPGMIRGKECMYV